MEIKLAMVARSPARPLHHQARLYRLADPAKFALMS